MPDEDRSFFAPIEELIGKEGTMAPYALIEHRSGTAPNIGEVQFVRKRDHGAFTVGWERDGMHITTVFGCGSWELMKLDDISFRLTRTDSNPKGESDMPPNEATRYLLILRERTPDGL